MTRIFFALTVAVLLVQAIVGQETETDWKQHVIPTKERMFDFQTVARGSTPEHPFVLRNPLQETLRISGITSSCVCVTLDFDKEETILKTYEKIVIRARLQGDLFEGQRNSTITVFIEEPVRTEIQLHVRGEIRNDLRIVPEFINFGNVASGREHTRTLTVTYTGQNTQWRLLDARSENEFIRAVITPGQIGVNRREFRVAVSIDESAPNGAINTHLVLISNDAAARREIPISIRATVGTAIRVTPPHLSLGILSPGEPSSIREARLVGTRPFRISKIESDNPAIDVDVVVLDATREDAPRIVHPLMISYRNPTEGEGVPDENGIMRASIRIMTDVPGLVASFYVTATVRERD